MFDLDKIGERVKILRMKSGYTQEQVAEKLGLDFGSYRSIETGRRKGRVETLCVIADFFSVPLDYLVGRDKDMMEELNWRIKKLSCEKQKIAVQIFFAVLDVFHRDETTK